MRLPSLFLAVFAAGCATTGSSTAPKPCVLRSAGNDVLRVALRADATCTTKDGALHAESRDGEFDIWLVPGAKGIDEAAARIPMQIQSEFKDFKASSTTPLTVAGSPAKELAGSGTEADDGDPGDADVIVFKVGDRIFIACTHAESLSSSAKSWMAGVVQTARVP